MAFKDLRFSKNQLDSAGTFYELMLLILKNKGMTDSNKDATIESECKTELLSKLDLEVLKEIREDIQKSLEDSTTKEIMTSFKKLYMREDPDALRIINLFKNLNEKTSDLEFLKRETKMLEGLLSNLNGKQVAGLYALLKWDAPCGAEAAILSRIVSSEKVSTGDEMIHMIQSITAMTVTANITKSTTVGKVYNNVATKKSFRKKNDIRCFLCGKMGHIKSHCPEYTIQRKVKLITEREVMDREESDDDLSSIGMIDQVGKVSNGKRRLLIDIEIDGRKMKAEADTGSPVSFVSKTNFDNNCVQPTKRRFCGLGGNEIKIYGKANVMLKINDKLFNAIVYIADIDHGIIGLEELKSAGLINSLLQLVSIINEPEKDEKAINKFVERFPKLFSPGLGCYTGQPVRLKWKREPELLDKIKQHKSEGLWCEEKYPISTSPVTCIIKKPESGVSTENIRFVSDFKCLNKNLEKNCFPLESVDVILKKVSRMLSKDCKINCLDISDFYHCIPLAKVDQRKCSVTIMNRTLRMLRLPQGIAQAPAIAMEIMQSISQELKDEISKSKVSINGGRQFIEVYFDDLFIITLSESETEFVLNKLFKLLEFYGLKLNKKKLQLNKTKANILGVVVTPTSIQYDESKIAKLRSLKTPQTTEELLSFLGMLNQMTCFIPGLANIRSELDKKRSEKPFKPLTKIEKECYDKCIETAANAIKLTPVGETTTFTVQSDASSIGAGGILKNERGEILAVYSKTFSKSEKRYPITHREALAAILSIEHWSHYLRLRKFTLETDHSALLQIFQQDNYSRKAKSSRLVKFGLRLMSFDFTVKYIPGKNIGPADCLSRLLVEFKQEHGEEIIAKVVTPNELFLDLNSIKECMVNDEEAKELLNSIPNKDLPDIRMEDQVLKVGDTTYVPKVLRKKVMEILHYTHAGSSKMKSWGRKYFYWKSFSNDINDLVRSCSECKKFQRMPNKTEYYMEPSFYALQRVHLDLCELTDEKEGKCMILIIVDSYSGYVYGTLMKGISSKEIKSELLKYMTYVGIPTYFFSDQGRQFIAEDVQQLVKRWGCSWIFSGSGHQSSNGQAERFVGTIKNALKKMGPNKGTVEERLARVIISINNVECGIRKETPLNMIKERMVHPLIKEDERTSNSKFKKGELVMFKKRKEDEWKSGVVDESVGKMVKIRRGLVQYLFHIDNVRKCNVNMDGLSLDSVMTKKKPIDVSKCKNKRKIVDDHVEAPIRKFRVTKQRTDAFKYSK
uniref:RNA-directed DNA polymerase n=1 Tax=Strongyloides papillosus TaxID=174720 RepID=A0A0N5C6S7_STREA